MSILPRHVFADLLAIRFTRSGCAHRRDDGLAQPGRWVQATGRTGRRTATWMIRPQAHYDGLGNGGPI